MQNLGLGLKRTTSQKTLELFIRALGKRSPLNPPTKSTRRLFDGVADGIEGIYIDQLSDVLIAHTHQGKSSGVLLHNDLALIASDYLQRCGATTLYLWQHYNQGGKNSVKLITGCNREHFELPVGDLLYSVMPTKHPYGGFFVDSEVVRKWLLENSNSKRVLNLFCFSGTLGVAAAAGGALEVVQVDSAQSALDWSRRNWELNGYDKISNTKLRLIRDDVIQFLRKEHRRVRAGRELYDTIIIDPPSFGRARNRTFTIIKDYPKILESAIPVCKIGGELLLISNNRGMSPNHLWLSAKRIADSLMTTIERTGDIIPLRQEFRCALDSSIALRGVSVRVLGKEGSASAN